MPIRKPLAKFVEWPEPKIFGNVVKYTIVYTQPNYSDPSKEWKHQAVEADLSDAAIDLLVNLKKGDLFCVHQDKTADGYPLIVDLTDKKDADQKTDNGKAYTKGSGKRYDDSGAAVGGAWRFAIDILKEGLKLEDVAEMAKQVLTMTQGQVKALQATKIEVDKKQEAAKPLTRAEAAKAKKEAEDNAKQVAKVETPVDNEASFDPDEVPQFDKE